MQLTILPFALSDLDLPNVSLRWIHLIAGVLWIGILWFFNWINGAVVATLDGETKKKVVPEIMPRALFWFRWGAAFTWLSGVALLMHLYYAGDRGYLLADGTKPELMAWLPAFAGLFVGFIAYDLVMKTVGKANDALGVVIWGAIAVGFAYWLSEMSEFSGRATYIHVGALFGTSMAANVWMRIWPAQKIIVPGIKSGEGSDPALAALAGQRSRQNTFMSIPLLLFMVSVDQTALTGHESPWMVVAGVLVIGWVITWAIFKMVPSVKGW